MTDRTTTLCEKLTQIQTELHAPKNLTNSFGGYAYRNLESVLQALKPLLSLTQTVVTLSDEVIAVGGNSYVKATATFTDGEASMEVFGWAQEQPRKGMDAAQVTGACSSYARKYAMNGLFAIDNTPDADSKDNSDIKYTDKKDIERALETLNTCSEKGDAKKAKEIFDWAEKQNPQVIQVCDRYYMLFGDES
jgi:hypothetical protein